MALPVPLAVCVREVLIEIAAAIIQIFTEAGRGATHGAVELGYAVCHASMPASWHHLTPPNVCERRAPANDFVRAYSLRDECQEFVQSVKFDYITYHKTTLGALAPTRPGPARDLRTSIRKVEN